MLHQHKGHTGIYWETLQQLAECLQTARGRPNGHNREGLLGKAAGGGGLRPCRKPARSRAFPSLLRSGGFAGALLVIVAFLLMAASRKRTRGMISSSPYDPFIRAC